jgi:GTP-binding protein
MVSAPLGGGGEGVCSGWDCLSAAVMAEGAQHKMANANASRPCLQVNTSPFAGKEGKFVTSRNIKDRLDRWGECWIHCVKSVISKS